MRQPSPRRWQTWRLTPAPRRTRAAFTPDAILHRMALPAGSDRTPPPGPAVPPELRAEAPGADGIRHGLVAHVRQLIAEGAYDTPERWAAAEEQLFRRCLSEPEA